MAMQSLSMAGYFLFLGDPRVVPKCTHRLLDVILIAVCGVISGCDDWQQIDAFGNRRHDWLRGFLMLPGGIPSQDTLERVFDQLEPQAFAECFQEWTAHVCRRVGVAQIALDGKTLRGSRDSLGHSLHWVSAWATDLHLSLGQVVVQEKSNEITAIPKLLDLLEIEGAIVSIDAMGCQKAIAEKIVTGGGDYVLTVKENQPHLKEDIEASFLAAEEADFAEVDVDTYATEEKGHGREEQRSYMIITNPKGLRNQAAWRKLTVIGRCYSVRTETGQTSEQVRYFLGSRATSAAAYGRALRGHWGIENNQHWQLDVSFSEDQSRIQKRHAATNFAFLRRIALNLLKRHPSKSSIATKRKEAAWDTDFLEEVLALLKTG